MGIIFFEVCLHPFVSESSGSNQAVLNSNFVQHRVVRHAPTALLNEIIHAITARLYNLKHAAITPLYTL